MLKKPQLYTFNLQNVSATVDADEDSEHKEGP